MIIIIDSKLPVLKKVVVMQKHNTIINNGIINITVNNNNNNITIFYDMIESFLPCECFPRAPTTPY